MKRIAVLLLLVTTSALAKTPWETYLDEPSSRNAAHVESIAYSTPVEGGYDSDDLAILHLQVLAADPAAFQLADRLREKSDGGLAEELSAILASAIRPHPEFFLDQVRALKRPCSDFNIDAAGIEYVDRPVAQKYELHMRQVALASVAAKSLEKVRSECLARLATIR